MRRWCMISLLNLENAEALYNPAEEDVVVEIQP